MVIISLPEIAQAEEAYYAHKYEKEIAYVCPNGEMPLTEQETRLKDFLETEVRNEKSCL